jgi:hypothetical protein
MMCNVFVGSKLTFLTFHRTRGPDSHGKMLARFHLATGLGALNNFVPLSLLLKLGTKQETDKMAIGKPIDPTGKVDQNHIY